MNEQQMASLPRSPALTENVRTPALVVLVELEELAYVRLRAASAEDERRLRLWLARPATRRAVVDSIEDAFDRLEQREAA